MALKAHVGFSVPVADQLGRRVVSHFSKLGYRLIDEFDDEWQFHRGNKWSVLWRFNICAYSTKLIVRAAREQSGGTWVSCDWEVWTFMTITTGGDIATLEAEAYQLESALRKSYSNRSNLPSDSNIKSE